MCMGLNIKVSKNKRTCKNTNGHIDEEKNSYHETLPTSTSASATMKSTVYLRRGVGDEDVDDSKRQHRADLFMSQASTEKLLLGHLK